MYTQLHESLRAQILEQTQRMVLDTVKEAIAGVRDTTCDPMTKLESIANLLTSLGVILPSAFPGPATTVTIPAPKAVIPLNLASMRDKTPTVEDLGNLLGELQVHRRFASAYLQSATGRFRMEDHKDHPHPEWPTWDVLREELWFAEQALKSMVAGSDAFA